jgi:hypothetical protein
MKKILVVTTRPLETNVSSSIRKISTIQALISEGVEVSLITTNVLNESQNINNNVNLNIKKIIRIENFQTYKKGVQSLTNSGILKYIKKKLRNIYYKFSIYDPLKMTKFKVTAVARNRKNGLQHGKIRTEIIDTATNSIFAGMNDIMSVKRQYEHFFPYKFRNERGRWVRFCTYFSYKVKVNAVRCLFSFSISLFRSFSFYFFRLYYFSQDSLAMLER